MTGKQRTPGWEGEAPAEPKSRLPKRKHPAHGVLLNKGQPTIVFLTIGTKHRRPWLATHETHELLRSVWIETDAWLVGRYVVMPDHIHLFAGLSVVGMGRAFVREHGTADQKTLSLLVGSAGASPSRLDRPASWAPRLEISFDNWVRYWKSQFTKRHGCPEHRWHPDHWDTRLRRGESYDTKWDYVRHNPVRHGLVDRPEVWPFQGEIHELPWW